MAVMEKRKIQQSIDAESNFQRSCLLCGVGGQGTVLASRILAQAAMEKGYFARTAETIGMAQRGGCVVSHVRFGKCVAASMIPLGKADVIIGFEPGEAVRNLEYLKPGGLVITCRRKVEPVMSALTGSSYSGEEMVAYLQERVPHCIVIDGEEICRKCGSSKVLNVALVGAVARSGALGITIEEVDAVLEKRIKPALLEMNRIALHSK